jgi:hypothetical protein
MHRTGFKHKVFSHLAACVQASIFIGIVIGHNWHGLCECNRAKEKPSHADDEHAVTFMEEL